MTSFTFDAKAALHRTQTRSPHTNPPILPNRSDSDGAGFEGLGRLGTVYLQSLEMTPEELARDYCEERAAIREYDGGQDRAEAEAAALAEARCTFPEVDL
ncbi:hypothetical protein [Roseovarius sp. ZX-A-9]|uniref:hypothetical protein n=1 Tax=Roseovarius sp. ZX-A-9 TaxID=3014783 RepID=UPI0023303BFA|nr:hypothetical protein [Roseovarius sp. ZX-A-9]